MKRAELIHRRRVNTAWLILISTVLIVAAQISDAALIDHSEWTGWLLFSVFTALLIYAGRRRLSTLPLGPMALWLQAHIYLGMFAVLVLFLHSDWRLPHGLIGWSLTISFFGTVASGIVGLFWSRSLPRRITFLGDEVLYDRIQSFSAGLRQRAEQLSADALSKTGSRALADFYRTSAYRLFARPEFQWRRLYRHSKPTRKIEHELSVLQRYSSEEETEFLEEMLNLIRQKSVLDGHWTYQGALRYWLFIHLSFSLAVVPLIFLHIILVYGFSAA